MVGCYAQMNGNRISEIPGVRLVLGNEEKMNLPNHINRLEQEGRNQVLIPGIKRGSFQAPIIPKTGNSKELDDSANAWEFRTMVRNSQAFAESSNSLLFPVLGMMGA